MRNDRERALDKVRKLLAMANDGRGNVNEAEAAARQAAALMTKYNIEAAETQLDDLCGDSPDLSQEFYEPAYDPGAKKAPKEVPQWLGIIAVGVGRLCQVKVDGTRRGDGRTSLRFSGYSTDVVFAQWLMAMLSRAVFFEARNQWGHASKAEREAFRRGAASQLQRRLYEMRAQQDAELNNNSNERGSSMALVVINKKSQVLAAEFGEQSTRVIKTRVNHGSAHADGQSFANKMNIPGARPLSSSNSNGALK